MQNLLEEACGINPRILKQELVTILETVTNLPNLQRFTKQELCLALFWSRALDLGVPALPLNPNLQDLGRQLRGKGLLIQQLADELQHPKPKGTPFKKKQKGQEIVEHPDLRRPQLQRIAQALAPFLGDQELPISSFQRIDRDLYQVSFLQGFLEGTILTDPARFGWLEEILHSLEPGEFGRIVYAGPIPEHPGMFALLYQPASENDGLLTLGQLYQEAFRGNFDPLESLVEQLASLHCRFLLNGVALPLQYAEAYGLLKGRLVLRMIWPPTVDNQDFYTEAWYQEDQIEKLLDIAELASGGEKLPRKFLRELTQLYLMGMEQCRN